MKVIEAGRGGGKSSLCAAWVLEDPANRAMVTLHPGEVRRLMEKYPGLTRRNFIVLDKKKNPRDLIAETHRAVAVDDCDELIYTLIGPQVRVIAINKPRKEPS